jgi:hypothetical protein
MSWADKTFWVRRQPQNVVDYAIASEASLEELNIVLDMDPAKSTLEAARLSTPCRDCPQQQACMDSIWLDGKRMTGPQPGAAPLSDIVDCHYCSAPMLVLYQIGPAKAVPDKCPRRSKKAGNCDVCRKVRSRVAELHEAPSELRDAMRETVELAVSDPDLAPTWTHLSKLQRVDLMRRWVGLLCDAVLKDFDPALVTRVLVLELSDGPLEKAWLAKAPVARRFLIRCWEGLFRSTLIL